MLVNSNPATIMTDPELAQRTYVEPLEPKTLLAIVERERPDAILPTLGGQTALNLALALHDTGKLAELGVELIGASPAAIRKAEDRRLFKEAMRSIGLECARSGYATNLQEAIEIVERGTAESGGPTGYPVIVRPSFTLGGTGGGIAKDRADLEAKIAWALDQSKANEVLIEESILGWKEFELEVIRDKADNFIVICTIENVDPMGVHTGDSITVAPAMTLTDREYQRLRDAARRVMSEIGVETGGSNVQFAVSPSRRPPRGRRDEPARVALERAGLEGHRLPDREDRRQARGRLHARRAQERHHRHQRRLRADHRLRGRKVAALRVREVPGGRSAPRHADEERRRGDEHRPHLLRGAPEGRPLARDRARRLAEPVRPGRLRGARDRPEQRTRSGDGGAARARPAIAAQAGGQRARRHAARARRDPHVGSPLPRGRRAPRRRLGEGARRDDEDRPVVPRPARAHHGRRARPDARDPHGRRCAEARRGSSASASRTAASPRWSAAS